MRGYFLCIACCWTILINAQITGSVKDAEGLPIAYANVILNREMEQSMQTGTITNEDGHFELQYSGTGTYTLQVSLLSYTTWNSDPFALTDETAQRTFPSIVLAEEVTALEGVAVVGQRKLIERTQEGNVINVQQSILTKGSTALQLLERSPGVILDQRNNSFSLNGKSGTLIMINGKPQRIPTADLIALLNGMNANNIEKIELLTNPSARHDVDGNAGIINIVLSKSESNGFRGNATVSLGYGEGPKETHSLSLNYGKERTSMFLNYNFSYDDSFSGWVAQGSSDIPTLGGNTSIRFQSDRFEINRSHNLNLGLERQLSDQTTLGSQIVFNHSRPKQNIQNLGQYEFAINPFLEAQIELNGSGKWSNVNPSVFLEHSGENASWTIASDYIYYRNQTPNRVRSIYFDADGNQIQPENEIYNSGNRGFNDTQIHVGVLKMDFQKSLGEKVTVEAGVKASLSKTTNDARIEIQQGPDFISDERFISVLENKENIGAAYGIANFHPSTKTHIQAGLRYEYWDQDFGDINLNRSFGKLFLTLFWTYQLSDTTALNFAYNKRITRPNYADLASYLSYNGPTSVFSGNPNLLPAITDNLNLTYNNKSFSLSLMGSYEQNPIARYQITRNDLSNIAVIAPVNLDYQKSLDLQLNLPLRMAYWWNINLNGTLGIREFKLLHTVDQVIHDYWHYNFNGTHTFSISPNLSLEVSGWYTSAHFNGSSRVSGFGSLNTGIRKEFKNGSSIQFAITDIFESVDIQSKIGSIAQEVYGDVFTVNYSPESGFSRIFRLSFTYPFGNSKIKSPKTRTGASTEKSRI